MAGGLIILQQDNSEQAIQSADYPSSDQEKWAVKAVNL
jgi:hypothetical protein